MDVIDEDDIRLEVLSDKLDIWLVSVWWSKFNYALFIDNGYCLNKGQSVWIVEI